jgi:DNA-nicking Smr family endonuclease
MTEHSPDPRPNEPVELPVNGVLDLHTFRPRDVKDLVPEYLEACRERGILRVRVIHGKGIGNLRRTVHALLAKHPGVVSFALASEAFGGWGATIVQLEPRKP